MRNKNQSAFTPPDTTDNYCDSTLSEIKGKSSYVLGLIDSRKLHSIIGRPDDHIMRANVLESALFLRFWGEEGYLGATVLHHLEARQGN